MMEENGEKKKKKHQIKYKFDGDRETMDKMVEDRLNALDSLQKQLSMEITQTKHFVKDLYENYSKYVGNNSFDTTKNIEPKFTISSELSSFMELKEDEKISRMDAKKYIEKYAQDNDLITNKLTNGKTIKHINLDDKLKTIFKDQRNDNIPYNSIMKLTRDHFNIDK